MQTTTAETTDRAEQLEALGFSSEADYKQHHDLLQRAREQSEQTLQDTRAAGGLEYVHLSETGLHAGRRLCLAPKDQGRSVHAVYAPLHNPSFLASVCHACLHAWALEAYDDTDAIPEYLVEARAAAKLAAVAPKALIENEKGGQ